MPGSPCERCGRRLVCVYEDCEALGAGDPCVDADARAGFRIVLGPPHAVTGEQVFELWRGDLLIAALVPRRSNLTMVSKFMEGAINDIAHPTKVTVMWSLPT